MSLNFAEVVKISRSAIDCFRKGHSIKTLFMMWKGGDVE